MPPSLDTEDRPQSATRHKQDRRPSNMPASKSEGRKSMTSSEKRTAWERQQEEIRKLSAIIPLSDERERSKLGSQIGRDHSIGMLELSKRIEKLEQVATQYETLQTRLVTIEGLLKPYAAYEQHALGAVEQLKQIETRLQTERFSKTDTAIKQLVDEHEAKLQEHSTRLQQLLDQNELARNQPQSTADLAKSLIYRLAHGDLVDETLARSLRSALGGDSIIGLDAPRDAPRQEITPVTDNLDTRHDTDESVETPRPTKRPRIAKSTASSLSPTKDTARSQPAFRSSMPSALDNFKSGTLSHDRSSMESEQDERMEEVNHEPSSSRPVRAKKATQHPDMVPWRTAYPQVKHMRRSGSSPTKRLG
ncbi:hypothetical protein LTR78_004658 [Recurvomyces mirabilis]|uniref:Uncharacterized protein n=1 Tax=Recurvomyces mirabilis TaxID=574656 RepID=A0AAE0WPF5_9PEZI|nr:hypothetical protein LTR78_004658 [Recurvomyces mirabilis]KAK5152849.1 hypothetical protein LTS14_007956 [Recurvomyces mirabilis]